MREGQTIADVLEGRADWIVVTGDCLTVLPSIPAGSVVAICTDPPYGVDFAVWDASIPAWVGAARTCSPLVMFSTWPNTLWEYPKPDWVGCWYREAACSQASVGGFCHWSPIVVYGKPRWRVDSIKLHAIQHAQPSDVGHPCPKPTALMVWMVESASGVGDVILDPFCGSGTTGVACIKTGRRFIGIEIDPGYADIARRRIREAEPVLFTQAKPQQLTLGGQS